ncbi:hypothetical protein AJ78_05302 [Emergomyces pasteurianus Ep9510]|uniref:Uncharacterized protein n=1 Tax=Emergomyces pasteurianus Ep9510 TaxID=1447872 RepID=A0A1J9PCU2_9EURO|nr:hypothetical protein AJ78_05302 [Emergomyces pasteurianus Ep9510]
MKPELSLRHEVPRDSEPLAISECEDLWEHHKITKEMKEIARFDYLGLLEVPSSVNSPPASSGARVGDAFFGATKLVVVLDCRKNANNAPEKANPGGLVAENQPYDSRIAGFQDHQS